MNEELLYDTNPAVTELNHVDGFDPKKLMRKLTDDSDPNNTTERYYLDVVYRKLWFRLKHPQGAIKKLLKEITDQFAIVEARVYLDRNDPPDSYIANAIVKKYFNAEDKFGDKYLELAETAATGRALSDAGFGIQFADGSETLDPNVVDAPVNLAGSINTDTGEVITNPLTAPTAANTVQNQHRTVPTTPPTVSQPAPAPKPQLTRDMPVEQLMAVMTVEDAKKIVVDCGIFKGKTLGQVACEKPQSLDWYIHSYKGNDNILRAGARVLVEKATA